jgi:transcriptional regulator with XRE-family HTH domain
VKISLIIGRYIKNQRELKHLSSKQLSMLSLVDYTTLMNIENGKVMPKIQTLVKLTRILEISLESVLKDADYTS